MTTTTPLFITGYRRIDDAIYPPSRLNPPLGSHAPSAHDGRSPPLSKTSANFTHSLDLQNSQGHLASLNYLSNRSSYRHGPPRQSPQRSPSLRMKVLRLCGPTSTLWNYNLHSEHPSEEDVAQARHRRRARGPRQLPPARLRHHLQEAVKVRRPRERIPDAVPEPPTPCTESE